MRQFIVHFSLICLLPFHFALIASEALAASEKAQDISSKYTDYSISYVINDDGSFTEERAWTLKILKKQALEDAKKTAIAYSTSIQTAEILQAYTLKTDGKKVDSPKDNFQTVISGGKDKNKAVFSDQSSISVVFPDVELGDSVVFKYRLTATEPIFANHFSETESFYKTYTYENLNIRINAPENLPLNYATRELKQIKNSIENKRRLIVWSWQNREPIISNRNDYSVYNFDEDAGFSISTFNNNSQIADAYGKRATPKAIINERINKLANDISPNKDSDAETARKLYEWVSLNITYAGNDVGLGAVVPHDLDFVLDNRMGDCKDHATLLQALLAAKNIISVQALLNATTIYKLPKVPVVSMVNHVINYIPTLDLYVDSTSDRTPFGLLPLGDQDKYVLLVDGSKAGAKTPVDKIEANQQQLVANLTIAADGSVTGETKISLNGTPAITARANARAASQDQEKNAIKNYFKYQNKVATGDYKKDDPKALIDQYAYAFNYQVNSLFTFAKTGVININPLFAGHQSISSALNQSSQDDDEYDVLCTAAKSSETLVYTFPKELKIISVPDDMELDNGTLTYRAKYNLIGNTLKVSRQFDDKTKGNVCTAKTMKDYDAFVKQVKPNYEDIVIYKKVR